MITSRTHYLHRPLRRQASFHPAQVQKSRQPWIRPKRKFYFQHSHPRPSPWHRSQQEVSHQVPRIPTLRARRQSRQVPSIALWRLYASAGKIQCRHRQARYRCHHQQSRLSCRSAHVLPLPCQQRKMGLSTEQGHDLERVQSAANGLRTGDGLRLKAPGCYASGVGKQCIYRR